jgi:hypothetical protein
MASPEPSLFKNETITVIFRPRQDTGFDQVAKVRPGMSLGSFSVFVSRAGPRHL